MLMCWPEKQQHVPFVTIPNMQPPDPTLIPSIDTTPDPQRLGRWDSILTLAPLALTALAIRVVIAPLVGHHVDMHAFVEWGRSLADVGFAQFYNAHPECDYLPGYLYVLWACGKLASIAPPHAHYLIFKFPNLLADLGTAWLIWRLTCPSKDRLRLVWPALYLFNPVIIFNSAYWGQADSFQAFVLLFALSLTRRRWWLLSALVMGYACTVKPHSVIAVLLVIVATYVQGIGLWRLLVCCGLAGAAFFGAFAPFAVDASVSVFDLAFERIRITMDLYPYASVNALNLWYALGKNWVHASTPLWGAVSIRMVSDPLVIGGLVLALVQLVRSGRSIDARYWRVGAALFLVTFFCSSRVHERHNFPAFALLLCAAPWWNRAVIVYAILSLTTFVNMVLAWAYLYSEPRSAILGPPWLTGTLCVLNCLALILVFWRFGREDAEPAKWMQRFSTRIATLATKAKTIRTLPIAAILLFAFGTRIIRLDQPDTRVFDEVYHAYTAEQWAKGNTDPWRWDTKTPDEGCSYEWTHPPLAKLIMTASIRVLGVNAFAWRLPAALLGTLCVYLVYVIGWQLFSNRAVGLLAAGFMVFDTLPLMMSRIAMNDMYCLVFVLLGVMACLRNRHYTSAVLTGCAIACKWTGLFALPLLLVIRLQISKNASLRPSMRLVAQTTGQGLILLAVYVASYTPFFRAGNSIADFFELQRQMLTYHQSDLTHDGSSKAWEWPLADGTLWLYENEAKADEAPTEANIYALGNPLIWWPGLGAFAFCLLQVFRRRQPELVIAMFGYLVFWTPWIVSPRIMFIYHYLPALPFLYLLLAWSLVATDMDKRVIRTMLGAAAVVLGVAFPYILGVPLPMP